MSRIPLLKFFRETGGSVSSRLGTAARFAGDFAAYSLVRLLIAVISAMPLDMGDSLCRTIGHLLGGVLGVRRRTTDGNLAQCFPEATAAQRQRLSSAMWHHLLLMMCEVAWAQRRLHLANWGEYVRFRDNKAMLRHLLSDRPTVLVTGHFGNFEIGGYAIGLMGLSTTTIARRLDNRFIDQWVARFRAARGQFMVDKNGCAPLIDRHLQNGGTLSLLADQHAGSSGCWVNFLGAPASCHKALALFSMTSQAPMVVGYTRRIDGQPMRFESGPVGIADPRHDEAGVCESVTSLTEWYNEQLSRAIAMAVDQYWWLHRRWREPPERVARRLALQREQVKERQQAA